MKLLFVFLLCLFFSSCDFLTFDDYSVKIIPEEGTEYFCGETVDIVFSHQVDSYYAEKSVILKSKESPIDLNYTWSGTTLSVKPKDGWIKGTTYFAFIDGQIHLKTGSTFIAYQRTVFTYGEKNDSFYAIIPENLESVGLDYSFLINFNKPVSKQLFKKNFSLDCEEEYLIKESEDLQTYTICPKKNWAVNKNYSWILKVFKNDEYILEKEMSGYFGTIRDTVRPEVVNICPVQIDEDFIYTSDSENSNIFWYDSSCFLDFMKRDMAFGVEFSKPMDSSSVSNGISLIPTINLLTKQVDSNGTKYIFIPNEPYKIYTEYTIIINEGIKDKHGLSLEKAEKVTFISSDEYLKITEIKINNTIVALTSFDLVEIDDDNDNENDSVRLYFSISFSKRINKDELKNVFEKNSVKLLFPSTSLNPIMTNIYWNDECNTVFFTYENFEKKTEISTPIYQLKINGGLNGIIAADECYLEDDVCVNFVLR